MGGGYLKKRGNPNQAKILEEIKQMGYKVRVKRNQICIEDLEPMTIKMAQEFISKKKKEEDPLKGHDKNCETADPKTVRKCKCSCKGRYHGIRSQKKLFQFMELEYYG